MSKASEWAETQAQRPRRSFGATNVEVSTGGGLSIIVSASTAVTIPAKEVMPLARWLLEVFGDDA